MSVKHWGEIPKNPELIPDVTEDIEKAMDKFCLSECEVKETDEVSRNIVLSSEDPLVMYAISLHKYMDHMTDIIRLAIDTKVKPSKDAAPSIPEPPEIYLKHKQNNLNFIPKEDTDFSLGKEVEIPFFNELIINKVLRKSICILLAHIGYESTHESLLSILTDVLREFYRIFCSKMEIAIHDEKDNETSGFPHVIERVLVDIGMGGVKGLHDYYQARVIKYVNVLQGRCKELNDHYKKLLITKSPSPINELSKIVKIEKEENPEVHLLDGEIELSSLETGFQLLDSLEAEANLQNLTEADEDILTAETTGNIPSDIELPSSFAKRRRSNL